MIQSAVAGMMLAGCQSKPKDKIPSAELERPEHHAAKMTVEGQTPGDGPFGWRVLPVSGGASARLEWPAMKGSAPAKLRVTLAREARPGTILDVCSARTGKVVGQFDIRYGYTLQMFEVWLDAAAVTEACAGGLLLRNYGKVPLWLVAEADGAVVMPHLMTGEAAGRPLLSDAPSSRREAMLSRLASVNSFHYPGWMEGCVLDALRDLHAATGEGRFLGALQDHIGWFLDSADAARANAPGGLAVRTIEATLPAAVIGRYRPNHPWIDQALSFWASHADAQGCVQDGTTTSAEGSYTVAYPMAVLAQVRNDQGLYDRAITQLMRRKERLAKDRDIHLRLYGSNGPGRLYMKNWSRGIAWYYLGLVRTLIELPLSRRPMALTDEVKRVADVVLARRRAGGLWHCYAGEPETGLETSGSAGIAAALALAARHDLLGMEYGRTAETTLKALWAHVTPDGFMTGVTQSNAGGEDLQRSGYRVIAQFGAGLAGQLVAARVGPG